MKTRWLGKLGVSEIGLGCMGLKDSRQSLLLINAAINKGITLFDTADVYQNEEFLGKVITKEQGVMIATKFGIRNGKKDGTPEYVRQACEASLKRLNRDVIDLYYLHRVDPDVPIQETVGAMGRLVQAGMVRCLGISGVTPYEIERANGTYPITAVQNEFSLWNKDAKYCDVLRACSEMEIGFVAYSPIGRGFSAGHFETFEDFPLDDKRRSNSDYQSKAGFAYKLGVWHGLKESAQLIDKTPSQLALAWVLAQGSNIVPIPGTKSVEHLCDNIEATKI